MAASGARERWRLVSARRCKEGQQVWVAEIAVWGVEHRRGGRWGCGSAAREGQQGGSIRAALEWSAREEGWGCLLS